MAPCSNTLLLAPETSAGLLDLVIIQSYNSTEYVLQKNYGNRCGYCYALPQR